MSKAPTHWRTLRKPVTNTQKLRFMQSCVSWMTTEPCIDEEEDTMLRTSSALAPPQTVDVSRQSVTSHVEARRSPVARQCVLCGDPSTAQHVINPFTVRSVAHLCDACAV